MFHDRSIGLSYVRISNTFLVNVHGADGPVFPMYHRERPVNLYVV